MIKEIIKNSYIEFKDVNFGRIENYPFTSAEKHEISFSRIAIEYDNGRILSISIPMSDVLLAIKYRDVMCMICVELAKKGFMYILRNERKNNEPIELHKEEMRRFVYTHIIGIAQNIYEIELMSRPNYKQHNEPPLDAPSRKA